MIIDGKKINDVGIQLSAFPFTGEETAKALIDLDDGFLDVDKIQKLQKIAPNAEETNDLRQYKGSRDCLDKA